MEVTTLPYTLTLKSPGGEETFQFDDEDTARSELAKLCEEYASRFGTCEAKITDPQGQTVEMRTNNFNA